MLIEPNYVRLAINMIQESFWFVRPSVIQFSYLKWLHHFDELSDEDRTKQNIINLCNSMIYMQNSFTILQKEIDQISHSYVGKCNFSGIQLPSQRVKQKGSEEGEIFSEGVSHLLFHGIFLQYFYYCSVNVFF